MVFCGFDADNILQECGTIITLDSIYWKTSRKKYAQQGISIPIGFRYFRLIIKYTISNTDDLTIYKRINR